MAVRAGSILHVGGNNVIDRIQSAGLGDARIEYEKILEVGNRLTVDKVPNDPDFTFSMESLDVSTETMAWLCGKLGGAAPNQPPGYLDAAGTAYRWSDVGYVNVTSPWKDAGSGQAGTVVAGHIVPGYFPTRLRYRFGTTDNAQQELELAGGSYYYALGAPVEQFDVGDGTETDFAPDDLPIPHRLGGAAGTTFRRVFGVHVGARLLNEGVDYTVAATGEITFAVAPATGASIRFCYFTDAAKAFPQTVHATTLVKPGAVKGRNIRVLLGAPGSRVRLPGTQSLELEASFETEVEREMGTEEVVGRTVNSQDVTGTLVNRARDPEAFMALLSRITGVASDEVIGYLNLNPIPLRIQIENPKNPAQVLKTIDVGDAIFSIPGTPARVNTATDFSLQFESVAGDFSEYGSNPPA